MTKEHYVQNHYTKIAKNYGLRSDSTMRDPFIRESEIDFIISCIFEFVSQNQRFPKLIDCGCGNANTLAQLRELFPEMELSGFEFNPDLLALAQSRQIPNCEIKLGDIREEFGYNEYDMVLSERVVVNLHSRKQQLKALENINKALRLDGHYLMIESFESSLNELNAMIQENNQIPMKASEHNFYIKPGVWVNGLRLGFKEVSAPVPENYLSTYFVLTRVFHPMLRTKDEKRINNRLIRFFIDGLDQAAGDFSPIKFYLLKKDK